MMEMFNKSRGYGFIHKKMMDNSGDPQFREHWRLCDPNVYFKVANIKRDKDEYEYAETSWAHRWNKVTCPKCLNKRKK